MIDTKEKMRTVKVNERGQIVIPEEMRKDLGIRGDTVLVLVEQGNKIVIQREADILEGIGAFWRGIAHRSLERAWDQEDDAWDAHYHGTQA